MNPALRLPPLPTIKDIIKLYRLRAVKQLSQNFLLDQGVTGRIVKRCGKISPVSEVLEVGPGPGSITRSIIRKLPKRIILVEKDERFKPTLDMLGEAFSLVNGKLETIYDDIRDVKLDKVFSQELKKDWHDSPPNIHIVGNLPFSISTNLIIRWLHDISEKKGAWALGRVKMTLTFQKEVAERLVSEICGEQRCRLSVMAQTWTKPKLEFIIPGNKFVPKPNVDVGVVTFTPLKIPFTNHEFTLFEKVNRHLFCFRQKYNQKCAGTLFPPEKRDSYVQLMYDIAGVNPHIRSFQLTLEDIDKLITAYKKICAENPEIVMYNHYASRKVVSKTLTKEITVDEYFDDMEEENEDEFENPNEYEEDREEKIFSGI